MAEINTVKDYNLKYKKRTEEKLRKKFNQEDGRISASTSEVDPESTFSIKSSEKESVK